MERIESVEDRGVGKCTVDEAHFDPGVRCDVLVQNTLRRESRQWQTDRLEVGACELVVRNWQC